MKTRNYIERVLEKPNAREILGGLNLLHFSTEMSLSQFQRLDEASRKEVQARKSSSSNESSHEVSLIHMNTEASLYDGKPGGDFNVN